MKTPDDKFLKIFHNNLVGMILTGEDHIITDVNDHLLQLAEMKRKDVIGKTGLELGLIDERFVKKIWQQFAENRKLLNKELSFKTKTNKIVHCLFSTEKIELDGKPYWLTTLIDISKRKKSEKELADIYERVTDGFVAIDSNWCYSFVNKKAGELLEKDPARLVGKHIWTEFPEDIDQPVYLAYHRAMENQEMITMEEYYQPYDRWFQNLIYPSPDGLSVFFSDITSRKKNEQLIVESELRFRTLTKTAPVGIFETDAKGLTTYVNETWMRYTGLSFEQAMGDAWMKVIHPEDREKQIKKWNSKTKTADASFSEYRIVDKRGRLRWVNGKAVPVIKADGEIAGYIGTIADVTESKNYQLEILKSHQKIDTLINTLDGIVWEADAKTFQFTYISKKAEDILGYPAEEWINDHQFWADHIHPDDKSWAIDYCITCTREKKQHDFEYRMMAKDGTVVWLRDIVSVIVENNQPIQLRGIMIDITENKKAEDALNQRTEQLRELSTHLQNVREEERTKIAREIHDELGQQLTGLKMDISWLKKKVTDTDPAIKTKFDNTISLVDATVDSIRRIATELRPSIIDDLGLNAALEWQVREFIERSGKEILYNNNFDDVNIDPDISIGLFRILQESLTNIARHARAETVIINIEKVKDAVQLLVQDNGVGFDTNKKRHSLSFGLLGIKERTHMMKGDFAINSKPGKGTRIEIKIPLV
jgi:PAS domain S-box-containing protein